MKTSIYDRIREKDRTIARETTGREDYFLLSPTRASLMRALKPLIEKHVRGRVLDAGAGSKAYAARLSEFAAEYVSLDVTVERAMPSVVGSVLGLPFADASFDTVFCSQVLEHVPEPATAVREIARVLVPGGTLLLTAPHLAYLHNEPHDYFRFTSHGLRHLCVSAGLEVEEIRPAGGLLSFLGHIPSVAGKALLRPVPLVYDCFLLLNGYWSRMVAWLDERLERRKLFALNYIVVARKSG
ncbi:MAG TPA: methyltransferase domain-containing protein [bacterium]|nr:methyltransferase domain-containing protein [bacterium]